MNDPTQALRENTTTYQNKYMIISVLGILCILFSRFYSIELIWLTRATANVQKNLNIG
jgi:hypothetical protein